MLSYGILEREGESNRERMKESCFVGVFWAFGLLHLHVSHVCLKNGENKRVLNKDFLIKKCHIIKKKYKLLFR